MPSTSPVPSTSVMASATPSPTPTPAPTASATPSPVPTCTFAPTTGEHISIISGTLYDAQGRVITTPMQVKLTAPDVTPAYQATVTSDNGSWVVNSVPNGANVTITVSGTGYAPRTRELGTGWYRPAVYGAYPDCTYTPEGKTVVNFGGTATTDDPDAPTFALQPESN